MGNERRVVVNCVLIPVGFTGEVEGGAEVTAELPLVMQAYRLIDSKGPEGIPNAVSTYAMYIRVRVCRSVHIVDGELSQCG